MDDFVGNAGAEEARKWVSTAEAMALLDLSRDYFLEQARERGYTRRNAYKTAPLFFLRKEIESWADFRRMRRQWLAKYPGRGVKPYKSVYKN